MSLLSSSRLRRRSSRGVSARAESSPPENDRSGGGGWLDRRLRRAVQRRLESLDGGRVVLRERGSRDVFGRPGDPPLEAVVTVHDPRFYRHLALGGHLGAGESYVQGHWDCDDLVALLRMFCRDPAAADRLESGWARWTAPLVRFVHRMHRNTTAGSRRNITAHYDLGDDFFRLFLDPTMAYSCAVFTSPECSLEAASREKFDQVCRRLDLSPADHVLEIGSGWGGFALHAARRYGCRVTTTTISRRQFEYTRCLVADHALGDRVTVLAEDYRRLTGTFDKLVSLEMIEAVGWQYLDTFFRVCSQRLKPDGAMLLQAITIPDQRFDVYRRSVDFIQHYVFPGGCLPSLGAICGSLGRATDMQIAGLDDLTAHYPETLARWRDRLRANAGRAVELGLPRELLRLFEFYFCYCEAGFRERFINDVQLLLVKPHWRGR